jgi:O-antigen/teichoic acid export membrane protein
MFNALCGNVTAAVNLEKPASRIYLRSTLINIILNLLFIPIFGMIGAAFITVLTDGLTTIQFYILLKSRMGLNTIYMKILRTLLAAVLMGIVVWFTNPLHLLIVIIGGILSYAALSFYLGIIDQKLIQSLMGKLKRV